jgi:hypothetical protein
LTPSFTPSASKPRDKLNANNIPVRVTITV